MSQSALPVRTVIDILTEAKDAVVKRDASLSIKLYEEVASHQLATNDQKAKSWFQIGNLHNVEKNYRKSLEAFTESLKFDQNNIEVYNVINDVLMVSKEWKLALYYLDQLITLYPNDNRFLWQRYITEARMEHDKRHWKAEIRAYQKVLNMGETLLISKDAYANIEWNIGLSYYESNKFHLSIKAFKRSLSYTESSRSDTDRYSAGVYAHMGLSYYHLFDYQNALHAINKSIKLNGSDPNHFMQRCFVYVRLKDFQSAHKDFQTVNELLKTKSEITKDMKMNLASLESEIQALKIYHDIEKTEKEKIKKKKQKQKKKKVISKPDIIATVKELHLVEVNPFTPPPPPQVPPLPKKTEFRSVTNSPYDWKHVQQKVVKKTELPMVKNETSEPMAAERAELSTPLINNGLEHINKGPEPIKQKSTPSCTICFDPPSSDISFICFVPCGHLVCQSCDNDLIKHSSNSECVCPICRQTIVTHQRMFF